MGLKLGSYSRDSDLISMECNILLGIFDSSLDHSNVLQSLRTQLKWRAGVEGK